MSSLFSDGNISREARLRSGNEFLAPEGDASYFVRVSVADADTLSRAEKLLAGIEGGIEKAVKRAMARAVSNLRASTAKAVQKRYAISSSNIRADENASVSYTYEDGIQAIIHFDGCRIPLYRFQGASPVTPTYDTSRRVRLMVGLSTEEEGIWRFMHPGVPASGHVLRSTAPKQFQNAFVARMRSTGHTGIFERTGGMTSRSKDEIEELFGPSVPQMLGSQEVADALVQSAMDKFDERLAHEVDVILAGLR